jgi:anaerobic magnesium-protoporphyrin IX monomethyl ester cyclase
MTSWGCPFGCTFCCVTSMYGKGYRRFSHQQTINAIKDYKPRRVFFLDDNLCADKGRALELFNKIKELKKVGLNFMWIAQVRADLAKDEEFIKQMALANCRRVFIGFESIVQDSLNDVVKNVTIETYIHAIDTFHKYGIPIHGMFIFGLDHDQKTVFKNTVDFCHKYGIESAQFLMITPFPGTKYYEDLDKKRLLSTDTDLYDGNHVIVNPLSMSAQEIFNGMVWSYEHLYSWISILKQFGRDLKNFHKENIRSIGYRVRKMFNNLFRNIGFRIIIRRLKWITRKYKDRLPK